MSTADWLREALAEFYAQAHRVSSRDVDDDQDARIDTTLQLLDLMSQHTVPQELRRLTELSLMNGDRVTVRMAGHEFEGHVSHEPSNGGTLIVQVPSS